MNLTSPYVLPYDVYYQPSSIAAERDICLRIALGHEVSSSRADSIDSTVLPFLLMGTSGGLAGSSIEPWKSTVKDWSGPSIHDSAIEWQLKSIRIDPQGWVMLAQMLLVDHEDHLIERIEIRDLVDPSSLVKVITGQKGFNPYPRAWSGIRFLLGNSRDISKSFTISAYFSRSLSEDEQALITEELQAWAPGLVFGAYGVAPIRPDECVAIPDEEIVVIGNHMEWTFSNFKAHSSAIEGLINVFASVSEKYVPVSELRVD